MYAPVILFVYNRKNNFLRTYEALKKCTGADHSDLFIFSDGPKDEKTKPIVDDLRKELKQISLDSPFHKTTIIESDVNKGLASSIIDGVTKVITEYGRAIVLEDDCLPSEFFLNYMNVALDYFADNKTIGSISGCAEVIDIPKDYTADIYLTRRSCSWGWGTWSDRWAKVDWSLSKGSKIFKSPKLIHQFNEAGTDRFLRLYRQLKKDTQSWSIRFGAQHILDEWFVVYPRYSYIYNIGDDGLGVHTKQNEIGPQYDLSLAIKDPKMQNIEYDSRIQRLLKKRASAGVLSEIKRMLATIVIVIKSNLIR